MNMDQSPTLPDNLSVGAKEAVHLARAVAKHSGRGFLCVEDLLLALVIAPAGLIAQAFHNLEADRIPAIYSCHMAVLAVARGEQTQTVELTDLFVAACSIARRVDHVIDAPRLLLALHACYREAFLRLSCGWETDVDK